MEISIRSKSYGKKKNYKVNTEGLKRYQAAIREAKAIGGAYESYVKAYYGKTKQLRTKGVSIKELGSSVLNPIQFDVYMSAHKTADVDSLINKQLKIRSADSALFLQKALKNEGFDISFERAMTNQLSRKMWDAIKDKYEEGKMLGLSAEEAEYRVAQDFFGSI